MKRGELAVEDPLGAFEVLLGETDGAVFVNWPSDFRPDGGIGDGFCPVGKDARVQQGIDPHLPVFAAHHRHRLRDVVARGRFDGDLIHHAGGGIEVFVGIDVAHGLEHRLEDFPGFRVGAARGGEAVNDTFDLTEVGFDGGDDFLLHGIGEGVAIKRAGVEAGGFGFGLKSGCVVPAGGGGTVGFPGPFEENADGGGI